MLREIVIPCSRCGRNICLADFFVKEGICQDCMNLWYNEKYSEKIEAYQEELMTI
jgi:hypothetical protein